MLKDVINILKDISLRHKGVRTFRYQGEKFNNAQNNHKTYQVYVDDISLHELNPTGMRTSYLPFFKISINLFLFSSLIDESGILTTESQYFE